MSKEDKEFFRDMFDTIKLLYCQREALFVSCERELKNWEPVWRVLQNDPDIIHQADQAFSEMYESIDAGSRDSELLAKVSKDPTSRRCIVCSSPAATCR